LLRIFVILATGSLFWFATAQDKAASDKSKAPDILTFAAKNGDVTFNHAKHTEREKQKCETCHPKPWPESKAPLNYKAAMHKTAEASKSSCATCHVEGGKSFASKGNCVKCHAKKGAKSAD
jgi:c(7)-type cytochrome triheme protein